ncbi:unnamed protein product [Adineta ricciae]|uniref:Uncharacterized protein n=1 Tax=Adineta ricciae TaxID=249248 RepID=A0A816F5L2_ADIRI|nr:unnamed protein product [Adineta ricciae]CAF1655331.1 unnamed protein product [Adineta ricciae]
MTNIFQHPRSIYIPLDAYVCCKHGFNSTYQNDLNGIINPDEFQESMNRINQPMLSCNKKLKIICIILCLMVLLGICFIISANVAAKKDSSFYNTLLTIGIVSIDGGVFLHLIACCVIICQRERKLRQAITKETIIYSSRSPITCGWRLENCGDENNADQNDYSHVVIDIVRPTTAVNSIYHFDQDNSLPPPPSYSDLFPRLSS